MKTHLRPLPAIAFLIISLGLVGSFALFTVKGLAEEPSERPCPPKIICAGTANCPPPPAWKACSSISESTECNAYQQGRAASCNTGSYEKCVDNEYQENLPACAGRTHDDPLQCGMHNCNVKCVWENGICVDDPSSDCSDITCAPECKEGSA